MGCMGNFALANPSTGNTEETFNRINDDDRDAILDTASTAYDNWRQTTIEERAAVLNRAADLYTERADELASYIGREMGKLIVLGEGRDRHRRRHLPLVCRARP